MSVFAPWVSHKLSRLRLLKNYRAGLVPAERVRDADFLLVTAAKFHGYPASLPCPVCERTDSLYLVYWVYGEELKGRAGSARSREEMERFAEAGLSFTVHEVEVCTECRWNHLLRTSTVQ